MMVIDDNCNNAAYFKLKYVEYIEFLCRIAQMAEL